MDVTEEIIEKVEGDYLRILIDLLRSTDIDVETAKQITREFLALVPFTSVEDLQNKIKLFTESHAEFGGLYIKLFRYEDEKKTAELIDKMKSHIKEKKLDEALSLVK